jgi:ankyrin repeat protein
MASRQARDDIEKIDMVADRISATQRKLDEHKSRARGGNANRIARAGDAAAAAAAAAAAVGPGAAGKVRTRKYGGEPSTKTKKAAAYNMAAKQAATQGKLEKRLLKACINGGEAEALMMIREGADLTCTDAHGRGPLHLALAHGEAGIVAALIKHRARFDVKDNRGQTAVHMAALVGDFQSMHKLIRAGAPVNMPDRRGQTALHSAVESGSLDVLAVLLKEARNAALDLKDVDGLTPLLLAVHLGHHQQAGLLLRKGADAALCTPDGLSPLHLATKMANMECIRSLVNARKDSLLLFDEHGRTATHLAATEGNSVVLEALLSAGAPLMILDESGRTPLHWAVVTNSMDCVKLLIDRKTDPNVRDKFGGAPLHYAIQQGDAESIAALAAAGADLEATDLKGRSPLVWGVIHDKHDACRKLLEAGAGVNTKDVSTWSPLHYACHTGRSRACTMLLHYGAEMDAVNATDHTPLFRAVIEGHTDCVTIMLVAGAAEHLHDSEGRNCLHWAALAGQNKIANVLLEAGCPVDKADLDGMQPLHQAASQGHSKVMASLLANGAVPNIPDLTGSTALHWAALSGATESVRLLLAKGADATCVDNGTPPQTAYDFAMHGRHFDCARLLHIAGLHGDLPPAQTQSKVHLPPIATNNAQAGEWVQYTPSPQKSNKSVTGRYPLAAGGKPTEASPRRSPTRAPPATREEKLVRQREDGWNFRTDNSDELTRRSPIPPQKGRAHYKEVLTADDAEYPGLRGPLLSARGGTAGKEKSLEAMLEYREREIADLKAKNRNLVSTVRAVSPQHPSLAITGKESKGGGVISDIAAKCAELRTTLDMGHLKLVPSKDGYLDETARKQRREIKKQVKAALEQVSKLRADTEMLAAKLVVDERGVEA